MFSLPMILAPRTARENMLGSMFSLPMILAPRTAHPDAHAMGLPPVRRDEP
jgi:hypothetical protein